MKINIKASQNHQNSLNRLASEKLKQIDLFSAIWSRIIKVKKELKKVWISQFYHNAWKPLFNLAIYYVFPDQALNFLSG